MLKHILVPLDGSTVAEKALEYARRITEVGGKITLLSVIDLPEYSFESFYPTGVLIENNQQMITEKLVPQAQGYLDLIAEPLGEAGWDVKAEVIIGEPAQAIVDRSNVLDVDAIVMSTHGRSGLSRWLFGSVTNKVLSVTDRPVFVVPIRKGRSAMLKDVKVKDWMTASVISVASDTPISVAHQIMKKNNVRRLPVIDNGQLVGVITIGDVREASPSDATTLSIWELNYLWAQLTVDKVMSKRVITVTPETAIVEAARLMLENKISGIIVVSDAKEVVGVVTESDIFKMLVKMQGLTITPNTVQRFN